MVSGASGAGTSSLEIRATLNTKDVERGFGKINASFQILSDKSDSANSDLERMNISARRLSKGLIGIGIAGATAFIGLAKGAPAVAPAMAKIGVQFERFQRTLGRALQPQFEAFSQGFKKFVDFADAHPDVLSGFVISGAALGGLKALTTLFGVAVSPSVLTGLALLGATGVAAATLETKTQNLKERFGITETPITEKIEQLPNVGIVGGIISEPLEVMFQVIQKVKENFVLISEELEKRKDRQFVTQNGADQSWS